MILNNFLYHFLWMREKIYAEMLFSAFGINGLSKRLLTCPQPFVAKLLRRYGAYIGPDSNLNSPLTIHCIDDKFRNLIVGSGCHIGQNVFLDLSEKIEISNDVTVAMGTCLLTHCNVGKSPLSGNGYKAKAEPIRIESGSYIGAASIILPGLTIGSCALIAAGSIVTNDVPAFHMVAGVPARIKKVINQK
jgi:acetyltransferase-like isoleucine patch superfamily enzyme